MVLVGLHVHANMEVVQSAPLEFSHAEKSCKKVPTILLDSLVEEPQKGYGVPNHLLESSK